MESREAAVKHLLTRNVEEVIERDHLERALKSGKKLRVKLGIDPTSPDLHLGHAVVLRKLREFQDLGHRIVLIIGDFTGRIGDPSGRSEARKPLTDAEISRNKKDYLAQAGKIVNVRKAEIRHNSEWFKKDGVRKLVGLAAAGSIQQALRREDFQKRIKLGKDISLLELFYSLLQGYDSVMVRADVELGGTDQLVNLLSGRKVQRYFGQKEQDVVTVPLLEGTDGTKKMSKSVGNYIGLTEAPDMVIGKVMALPDNLVSRYFLMCTELGAEKIRALERKLPPRNLKLRLGKEIAALYYGEAAAEKAADKWEKTFSRREVFATDLPTLKVPKKVRAVDLVLKSGLVKSKSEAWRLIMQGGLKVNDAAEDDPRATFAFSGGEILKIGKRHFFRVKV